MDYVHASRPIWTLLQGGASGADLLAHEWALAKEIRSITVPAKRSQHGRSAGLKRNLEMLGLIHPKYDAVIAFPGAPAPITDHMVGIARAAGFEPLIVGEREELR
jgi:hypothetical protein